MSNYTTLSQFTAEIDNQISELGLSMVRQPDTLTWIYELDTATSITLEVRFYTSLNNRAYYRVETFSVDAETGEDSGNVYGMFDNLPETLLCVIKERSKLKLNA
jgi:hypothetical protein